jgi:heme/copper-type cytochrome/quinol oxidase subunit 2
MCRTSQAKAGPNQDTGVNINNQLVYYHQSTVMISLGVGIIFVIVLLLVYCFIRYNRRRQQSPIQPQHYQQEMLRSPAMPTAPAYPSFYNQQMLRGSQDVQNLEAVNSLVEAMRAAHAPPKV